jgi:hypothetical protein
MNKAELITWIATLPEDSPALARVEACRARIAELNAERKLRETGTKQEGKGS